MSITSVPLLDKIQNHPIIYRDEKVVTFAMIDELHDRPAGTAGRNFRSNRYRFSEGKHFWDVGTDDEIRRRLIEACYTDKRTNNLILITERGYLNLVKSLTDDLSWEIQEKLVDCYFRAKGERQPQFEKQGSLEELLGAVGRFADREIARAQSVSPKKIGEELVRLQKKCEQQAKELNRLKRRNRVEKFKANKRFPPGPSKDGHDLSFVLYEWLIRKGHSRFTPRIVRQYGPAKLRNKDASTEAIEALTDQGFLTRLENCEIDGVMCKVAYELIEEAAGEKQ